MRIPTATYRLQLNHRMGFSDAKGIVPYLSDLGVSDVYSSPILKSRKGSMHGYDVVDPTKINPDLGGEKGFRDLAAAVSDAGMGWIQDIVPNHMAFDCDNGILMDVLEKGKNSRFFDYFDVLWDHPVQHMKNKLLVPVLGTPFEECLKNGEIRLGFGREGITIRYYEHRFPLSLRSYETVLLGKGRRTAGGEKEFSKEYDAFCRAVEKITKISSHDDPKAVHSEVEAGKNILWKLFHTQPQINEMVKTRIGIFNRKGKGKENAQGEAALLRRLLDEQWYRLAFWRDASEAINYRRFFDINGLISMNAERDEVFFHTHSLVLSLYEEGCISGLRIDHVDGLSDPLEYLRKLRANAPDAYIVVEKILDPDETLSSLWPVQGTTGYDYLNYLNGIFCRGDGEELFSTMYRDFTDQKLPFPEIVYACKKLIARQYLNGDVENLTSCADRLLKNAHPEMTFQRAYLKRALVELVSVFPVYRTYVSSDVDTPSDRKTIGAALNKARGRNETQNAALEILGRALLRESEFAASGVREEAVNFIMRFQQLTGPLMAKGFEDTALYVYLRLVSLNEVGSDPGRFGLSLDEYHRSVRERSGAWPHSMNATSTHDTKRGEDVRSRIHVLSEIPEEWMKVLGQWGEINAPKKGLVDGVPVPDANDEYLLYQTLVGALPFEEDQFPSFIQRVKDYVRKAVRESKRRSSWTEPNVGYEEGFLRFVDTITKRTPKNRFMTSFLRFQKRIAFYGVWNSLSQLLVKLTAPGIPDIYQGAELWNLTLVDPDNRSDVDFEKRTALLKELKELEKKNRGAFIENVLSHLEDGRIKLFVTWKVLEVRKKTSPLYLHGDYLPVNAEGRWKQHLICFARKFGDAWGITVAPRFLTTLAGEGKIPVGKQVWGDTCVILPVGAPEVFKDVFTEKAIVAKQNRIPVCELFSMFPLSHALSEGGLR